MAANSERLYVTYVEAFNGLLKIWGQPNRTCATYIEKQLLQLVPELNRSPGISPGSIHKGMICIAKYEDESYYRARIISDVINNAVLVLFIDYGNKDRVDLANLRMLGNPAENIISTIIPQAEEYFLANIKSDGGWAQDVMNEIRRGLCYNEYKFRTVCHAGSDKLIQISYRNEDYSGFLIRQDLAKPVSVKEQIILLRSTFKSQSMELMGTTFRTSSFNQQLPQSSGRDRFFHQNKVQLGAAAHVSSVLPLSQTSMFLQPQNRSELNRHAADRHFNIVNPLPRAFNQASNSPALSEPRGTPVINNVVIEALANQLKQHLMKEQFTSVPETPALGFVPQFLDVKTTHNVYISHIDDGPWSFSVQLVSNERELNQLMEDLAAYNFQPIKLPLTLGSPCIARSRKFDSYCRGVLLDISHSAVKVFYVDFGNTEDLPYNVLFEIPPRFFKVKTLSQRFALSGLQSVKPTEEIKKAFIEVVENELLILHVTNLEGENIPTCDLYLKDVNIKRILNEKLRLVKHWEPAQFPRCGEIENVLVTCVETAQRFFVQLKRCEPELRELKAELAKYGANAEILDPEDISPGAICICQYAPEKQWCRAVITSVNSMKSVTVFYVDYGYTEMVDIKLLRRVCGSAIGKMKIQAIPCCLHGYEGGICQSSNASALRELILGRELSLQVISEGNERINVQLLDNGKDVLLVLKNATYQSKPKFLSYDTQENSDNYASDNDSVNKRNSFKTSQSFSGRTGPDRMDLSSSRARNDSKPEKARADVFSWRSDDRPKDDSKNIKARDIWESASETKHEKYNGSKAGFGKSDDNRVARYGFKGKKIENIKDDKDWEKNWRGTENLEVYNPDEVAGIKMKLGESINDRMKRAARENEERGLKISDIGVPRQPVEIESLTFSGKIHENKEVPVGSTEEVLVTYFVDPQEIYVQLTSCKEKFRKFMIEIRDFYSTKLPMLNKPKKGDVVMCKFKEDGVLYRAIVIESDPITVRYVDFGNEEVSERENLWPMDKRFLDLESQCLKCILPDIKPVGSETWPTPNSEMDEIFEYETYSCTFLKKSGNGYEVKLVNLETGRDVRDELISAGFACSVKDSEEDSVKDFLGDSVPDTLQDTAQDSFQVSDGMFETEAEKFPLPMIKVKRLHEMPFDLFWDEVLDVLVTHVVDATEFYVQVRCGELNALENGILKYVGEKEFRSRAGRVIASIGNVCLVNVESDTWYRAEVIEKGEGNVTVSLMDHGYELSVNCEQIGPISKSLAQYPPQALRCCLLVRENKPIDELNEMFLSCVKNIYQAYFHKESDKGLKVTLYDEFGEKLKILSNYNSAPDWIRPISDLPITKRRMEVTVSHINSPLDMFVQRLDDLPDLKRLVSSMMTFYSKEVPEITGSLSEFQMYAVKSLTDDTWYRAQLLSHKNDTANMLFIDFGMTEKVPRENIRKLDPSFNEWYAYAKKVSLDICCPESAEKRITCQMQKMIGKKVCPAYFIKEKDIMYVEYVVDGSFITPQLVSDSVQIGDKDYFKKYRDEASEEEIKVYISHVNSPNEFWVHEERICPELAAFQDKLQAACSNGKEMENISVGDIVGVLFKDNLWYRALVTSMEGENVSISFLDYGNTYEIDKTENEFVDLDNELKKQDSFARKCSLQGSWKKNATSRFADIVFNYEDTHDLVEIDDEGDIIDLLQNGSSVTEQLINEGYEGPENDDIVFITHINSPTDFYIQKENDQKLFDMVIERMAGADSLQDPYEVVLNELYCAKFSEDDLWYRAQVICKDKEEIVVNFIDYGNCSVVSEIKDLPEDLKTLRPLSMNCCLVNVSQKDYWTEDAKNYLLKFLNNVPLKMEIVQQTSEINVVRLCTENGEDLSETLIALDESFDKVTKREPTVDGDIINGGNQSPSLSQEGPVSPAGNDSCPSGENVNSNGKPDVFLFGSNELPERSQSLSNFNAVANASAWISQGEKSENIRKLSGLGKIVPGISIRRLSLEEVSGRVITKPEEKLTRSSPGVSVESPLAEQQQKEDKTSPDTISNENVFAGAEDEMGCCDEGQVTFDETVEDKKN